MGKQRYRIIKDLRMRKVGDKWVLIHGVTLLAGPATKEVIKREMEFLLRAPTKNYLNLKKKGRRRVRFIVNPQKARKEFMRKFLEDPFYHDIYKRVINRVAQDLKQGKFDKRKWIKEFGSVAEKVAREHGISLSTLDKVKIGITLARRAWNKITGR